MTPGAAEAASPSPAVIRWRFAADIVDRSGAVERIEQRLGPRRSGPAPMPVRLVLVGLVMALLDGRRWQLLAAHEQLKSLPRHVQDRHGIRRRAHGYDRNPRPHGVVWSYRSLARRFMAIAQSMEESPHWARRHRLDLDDDQLAENAEFVREVCDRLLAASLPNGFADTDISVDATIVPAWMHRGATNERIEQDPDSVSDPDASWRGRANEEAQFGFSGHTAVSTHDSRLYVVATELATGSAAESPVGLRFVRRLKLRRPTDIAQAVEPNLLTTDRGYTRDHLFHEQLRSIGVNTVFDLNKHHLGNQGLIGDTGALYIDGWAHCPATPEGLHDLGRMPSRTDRATTAEEADEYWEAREERTAWEMVPNERAQPDGTIRVKCPAEAGLVVCPFKPGIEAKDGAPVVLDPPEPPTRDEQDEKSAKGHVCIQQTVRMPSLAGNKPLLPMAYGSEKYIDAFRPNRAWSESYFARLKDPSQGGMAKGSLRLRGLTRTRLLFTIACVALNLNDRYQQTRAEAEEITESNGQTTMFVAVDAIVPTAPQDHRAAATGTVP